MCTITVTPNDDGGLLVAPSCTDPNDSDQTNAHVKHGEKVTWTLGDNITYVISVFFKKNSPFSASACAGFGSAGGSVEAEPDTYEYGILVYDPSSEETWTSGDPKIIVGSGQGGEDLVKSILDDIESVNKDIQSMKKKVTKIGELLEVE